MSSIIPFPVLRGHIGGLILSNDSTTPNSVVDISAGQATDSTVSTIMTSNTALTVNFATTGAGALDTGSVAASTWYHVFLISSTTGGVAGLASANLTPSLPSGYGYFRRIGSVKTDGSSHILAFVQDEETFYWGLPTIDLNNISINSGSGRQLKTLNVPTGVKVRPLMRFAITANAAVTSPDEPDLVSANLSSYGFDSNTSDSPSNATAPSYLYTNTSAQLGFVANSGTGAAYVITRGWIDTRGKFA